MTDSPLRRQTKDQLIKEIERLKSRVAELESSALERASSAQDAAQNMLRWSEARFRSLIETAPGAILVSDARGQIVLVNRNVETLFGYQQDELIGMPVEVLLPERFREGHVGLHTRFFTQPETRPMGSGRELTGRRKGGAEFPVEIGLSYTPTDEGVLALAFIADITGRKRAEEALRASEARYRVVSELISDYAFCNRIEADGGMVTEWETDSFTRLTGYALTELYDLETKRFQSFFHPDDQARGDADMAKLLQGKTVDDDYRIITKSGETRWLRLHRQPVWDDGQGRVVRYYGVAQDITERKRAEEELRRRDTILEAISVASGLLLNASDWKQEIANVLGILGQADDADRAGIFQLHPDTHGILFASMRYEWDAAGVSPMLDNPMVQNVNIQDLNLGPELQRMIQKQPLYFRVKDRPLEMRQSAEITHVVASLFLPILLHGELWGTLYFATTRHERDRSKLELDTLQIAADMLGTVMERKEAEAELRQSAARLEILRQIDRAILVAASPQEVARAALLRIQQLIPCQDAAIWVIETENNERVLLAEMAGVVDLDPQDGYALDKRWKETLSQNQPYVISDLHSFSDPPVVFQNLLDRGVRSLASIPLFAQGELIGALDLIADEPNAFTEEYLEIADEITDQLAIAIRQARLLETERDQRNLAEALHDSAVAIGATLDLGAVLDTILTNIKRVIPYDAANIMLLKDGVARVVGVQGWAERGLGPWVAVRPAADIHLKWDPYPAGTNPEPYTIADTRADPDWVINKESQWIRSTAKAPILVGGQVLGALHLDSATPGAFTQQHLWRLQSFAHQASVAIHNAQLFEAEQRRRQIAEMLVRAAAILSSTLQLNQVLDLILHQLGDAIGYDSTSIQQLENDELTIIACAGFKNPDAIIGYKFPLVPKFPNFRVVMEKAPLSFDDVVQTYPHFPMEAERYASGTVHAWLGLPLLSKDRVIGVVTLDRLETRPFSTEDIELAMAFANQAALAIENARLYEQAARQAAELEERVKERTAQLEVANEELRALSRMKDEFVSNVSHELRTPVTNLNLRHFLLEKQPDRLDIHLPVLQRETARLARIIEDLLTLSRMDQDRIPFKLTLVDLSSLVQQFVMDRAPLADSQNLSLGFDGPSAPSPVQADAGLLEEALGVLLTNALNYTPSGGQVIVRTHRLRFDNGWWAGFSVSDTGPGIQQEEQAKLFTRFFRGKIGRASGVSGTGLGLAIAKEIVDRHHGQITVESEGVPGKGTTFTVWLPSSESTPV